eukprot:m.948974 g.948974  ORF g.948974 m.948974 type:complete len:85 (-) comp23851_c2_seq27:2659-2913(-)
MDPLLIGVGVGSVFETATSDENGLCSFCLRCSPQFQLLSDTLRATCSPPPQPIQVHSPTRNPLRCVRLVWWPRRVRFVLTHGWD